MRHGSIITLPPVRDLPWHGDTLFTCDEEVYSDTICWLSVGQRLLGLVWCEHDAQLTTTSTAPRWKPCARWRSSPPWLCPVAHGPAGSELAQNFGWKTLHSLTYNPDLAPKNFHLFRSLMEHWPGHRFTRDEDVKHATSWSWTNRDILSTRPRWTNLSHAVTNASHFKGTMMKNSVPVTPSLGIVSFLYYDLAFD